MGGSNQVIFLITALFVGQGAILGQGSAPFRYSYIRRSSRLGRGTRLDRASHDVAEPRRRYFGGMRGGVPSHGNLLLVGLGSDLRPSRAPHVAAPARRRAHPVAARRRRPAAPLPVASLQAD